MSNTVIARFEPRKTPLQARSAATVEAILQATIQVLLKEGRSKLTTTRVAARAGVSVGTLYQYFPNKSSLLQALLREHLDSVAAAVEDACAAVHGASIASIAQAITRAFLQAKFRNLDASVSLYAISDDVEGKRIVRDMHTRANRAMTAVLRTARDITFANPEITAATMLSAMAGVSRAMLEPGVTRFTMAIMQEQLTLMARAFLEASASSAPATPNPLQSRPPRAVASTPASHNSKSPRLRRSTSRQQQRA